MWKVFPCHDGNMDKVFRTFTDVNNAYDNDNSEGCRGNEGTARLQFTRQLHIYTINEGHHSWNMISYWFRMFRLSLWKKRVQIICILWSIFIALMLQ